MFNSRLLVGPILVLLLGSGTALCAPKIVTVAVNINLSTLDPYNTNETVGHAVAKTFYEGLFCFDDKERIRPTLASDWSVSADGLSYNIKLRRGIFFHDGSPFTSKAVKISLERAANPLNHLTHYELFNVIREVEIIDDYQVSIHLFRPFSAFLNQLAHPSSVMICPASLSKWGKDIGKHPCGTGPYRFVRWENGRVVAEKNHNYWRAGLPKLDQLNWVSLPSSAQRTQALQNNTVQFTNTLDYHQIQALKKNPALVIESRPSILTRYISLNTTKPPFTDVRVRQALNYAIDKQGLIDYAYDGNATVSQGVLPEGVDYAVKLGPWPYNPEKARQLLTAAGYPDGFKTTLWSAYGFSVASKASEYIKNQLAQVGVTVQLRTLTSSERSTLLVNHPDSESALVRMCYFGWSSSTHEPNWALRPLFSTATQPPNGLNTAYYSNLNVDSGLYNALRTSDRAQRKQIYTDLQKIIWNDAPWLFLLTERNIYAHARDLVGFHVMSDGSLFFEQADLIPRRH